MRQSNDQSCSSRDSSYIKDYDKILWQIK